jgi:Metal-dependent hydrolases of the beta-lactamase superfamily I
VKGKKITIVTDTGNITDEIFQSIRGSDILVIEANHEKNILLYGRYTYALKCWILSDIGHLSNEACGNCICSYLEDIRGG